MIRGIFPGTANARGRTGRTGLSVKERRVRPPAGAEPTPVTLLTGFLGSGKTTLLNDLLGDPCMDGAAVVVNEFGSVAVDHDLILKGEPATIISSEGCLCCTAAGDIRASLFELNEARARGEIPEFRRVIVETTGLADPAPIINSLIPGGAPPDTTHHQIVAQSFRLAGVVTTIDAENGEAAINGHFECWKQLAFADHIVLTKTDIASADAWKSILYAANPAATIHDRNAQGFDPVRLFQSRSYSPEGKPEDVLGWLAMERLSDPARHDHDHDPDRHGAAIAALPLVHDEPLDPRSIDLFLDILTSQHHAGLLRMKGIFALADDPSRPLVAHAVQQRLYPTLRLDGWPSDDMRSRLMIIGDNLPLEPIRDLFDSLRPRKRRRWFART